MVDKITIERGQSRQVEVDVTADGWFDGAWGGDERGQHGGPRSLGVRDGGQDALPGKGCQGGGAA